MVEQKRQRVNLMLCGGTGCIASGALKVADALKAEIKNGGLEETIGVVLTGCNGFCSRGPVMTGLPEGISYEV